MRSSHRPFTLAALVGLSVLVLTQAPAQAQYRRPVTPTVPPAARPFPPRAPITVPPVTSNPNYNPYVLPGMTLNQLGTIDVLSMDPTLMMNLRLYNSMYNPPVYVTNNYYPNPALLYSSGVLVPSVRTNPFAYYNPYFASFGLHP